MNFSKKTNAVKGQRCRDDFPASHTKQEKITLFIII